MKTRLIQHCESGWTTTEFASPETMTAHLDACGIKQTGININKNNRVELQGAPKFRGLCGPMWDGDALRYEDPTTYEFLST